MEAIITKPTRSIEGYNIIPGSMLSFDKKDNVLLGDRLKLDGYLTSYIRIQSPITGKDMLFKFICAVHRGDNYNKFPQLPVKIFYHGLDRLEEICQKRQGKHFIEIWKSEENSDLYFMA